MRILIFLTVLFPVLGLASPSWLKPEEGSSTDEKLEFWTGFSLFRSPWVAAPSSTTGRDGLGPLFNARSCDACHQNGGGGKLPAQGFGVVLRLSEGNDAKLGPKLVHSYGDQLQTLSIDSITGGDQVPAEGKLNIHWQAEGRVPRKVLSAGAHPGAISLRRPHIRIKEVAYGNELEKAQKSLRLAPPLFGLGVIDALDEKAILAHADPYDKNGDGISGRVNRVLNQQTGSLNVGRFGHKAEQPNLRQQIAAAFNADIGLTSWLYPKQNCSASQTACNSMVSGNSKKEGVEISREKLQAVTTFSTLLKAVKTQEQQKKQLAKKGYKYFVNTGCATCHIASLDNKNFIFSDLLLHDMGEGLADRRSVFSASGSEWRTAPLWGLSRKLQARQNVLLHDGRARTLEEAILWHDGEARAAKEKYLQLQGIPKQDLLKFLETL